MVDLSAITSQETDYANQRIADGPVASGNIPGFGDAFAAAVAEGRYYESMLGGYSAQKDYIQQSLDAYHDRYGETLANPMAGMPTSQEQADQFASIRQRFAERAEPQGDSDIPDRNSLTFPTDDEIAQGGLALQRKSLRDWADVGATGGPIAMLGGLAGQLVSGATDPINAAALAAAGALAGPEAGIVIKALYTGGAFGAAAGVQDLAGYENKRTVNPNFGLSDIPGDMENAAIWGAVGEVGFHVAGKIIGYGVKQATGYMPSELIGMGWRNISRTAPDIAGDMPLAVRDAGTVAERAADLDAQNPFAGQSGEAAHNEAVAAVEQQTIAGEPPEVPASATTEAAARTGAVYTARPLGTTGGLGVPPEGETYAALKFNDRLWKGQGRVWTGQDHASALDAAMADIGEKSADYQAGDVIAGQVGSDGKFTPNVTPANEPAAVAGPLRERILSAYSDASGGEWNKRVSLADIRARLPGVPRDDIDATLRAMHVDAEGAFHLSGTDNPPELTGRLREARVNFKGEDNYFAWQTRPPTMRAPPAREARTFYSTGASSVHAVRVKYEVAEARDLVTSHDDGFHANPAYPAELQPRNRGGKPAMEQVYGIANDLEPERLGPSVEANSGAPIVGPDNVVESGNGRAMALRMAHARGSAGPYRAFLERSGFDTSGFKEPILIGRRVTPMTSAEREAFAHAANGRASLGMSPVEQAMSDARHLTADVAALAHGGDVGSLANRDFTRAFMAKLSQGERASMQKADGGLSQAGVFRLRAAMAARAYGDADVIARLFNHPNVDIKTIGHGLEASAAGWIKMRDAATAGIIPPRQDITRDVMAAVKSILRAKDEGRPVGEIMQQADMFTSDTSSLAARLFFKDGEGFTKMRGKADMALNLTTFARDLRTGAEAGTSLFGEAPRSADQVLRDTLTAADRRTARLTAAARSSDAIAKSLADPKLDDSLFADLERNIEQGNNRYAKEDGTVGIADPELAGAKSDEALAGELKACTVPEAA